MAEFLRGRTLAWGLLLAACGPVCCTLAADPTSDAATPAAAPTQQEAPKADAPPPASPPPATAPAAQQAPPAAAPTPATPASPATDGEDGGAEAAADAPPPTHDVLLGCTKCRYLKKGCGSCRDRPVIVRKRTLRWKPEEGRPQEASRGEKSGLGCGGAGRRAGLQAGGRAGPRARPAHPFTHAPPRNPS